MRESRTEWRAAVMAVSAAVVMSSSPGVFSSRLSAQTDCSASVQADVARGWERYRASDMQAAGSAFNAALRRCPGLAGAQVGLGYVQLRANALSRAIVLFDSALVKNARDVDALVGRGIAAFRQGKGEDARGFFLRAQAIEPLNEEARTYLARLPARETPPVRAALMRPSAVDYVARTAGDHFEVRTSAGWAPFYLKGINLGAALPGRHPSEFPDAATYTEWISQIAGMGANSIRLYTIHPPAFYNALYAYNRAHTDKPIWIVHGVWTELPPAHNFDNVAWKRGFYTEMERVVDVLHGRADLEARPGHAAGFYTSDVSQWTLAYIIGREWEPFALIEFNKASKRRNWNGKYLTLAGGSASDSWMAEASEHIVSYEMDRYNAQRPVAYTNWPTLDPLHHPGETNVTEEMAIRRARGELNIIRPLEYDNDGPSLDATLAHATANFPAGWFASYHAYPYYPDFMIYSPAFSLASSSEGPSNYFGYLQALKKHHAGMPVVISEYGVPAGTGTGHLQPQGWNHGGVTESQMSAINSRMTREIAEAGMAGGMLFAWIDEWFKKNWMVIDFEIPQDRTRVWHNRLDAEQHYGVYAMDAVAPVAGASLDERRPAWLKQPSLYEDANGSVRAASDASYLWLLIEPRAGARLGEVMIGFDMLGGQTGDRRWPGQVGAELPTGIEFVLHASGDSVRVLADTHVNPWKIVPVAPTAKAPLSQPNVDRSLPGFFTGRYEMRMNRPFRSIANADGVYEGLRVIPNRRRVTADGGDIAAAGYDRGVLRQGGLPDGEWQRASDGSLEVRIPWMLLNVTDPSQRRVLLDRPGVKTGAIGTTLIDGIRIVARAEVNSANVSWPSRPVAAQVAMFTWPKWEEPLYVARQRPLYGEMKRVFEMLQPAVLQKGGR